MLTIRDGDVEASVNLDELERLMARAGMESERVVLRDFRRRIDEMFEDARRAWPVGRRNPGDYQPHSRDLLHTRVTLDAGGSVSARLISPAGYTRYIGARNPSEKAKRGAEEVNPRGYQPGRRAAQSGIVRWTLLGWPQNWHRKDVEKELGTEIEAAMQRAVGAP